MKESTFFDKPLALTEPTIPQTKFPTAQKRIQKTRATTTNDAVETAAEEIKGSLDGSRAFGLLIALAATAPKAAIIRIKKINHKKNITIDPIATLRIFLNSSRVTFSR